MQRMCLALLRFCLCTWAGVAIFFVAAVLDVLDSLLSDRPPLNRFANPTYFCPPYFAFAVLLLGAALLCAFVGLRNKRIGLFRRWVILSFVVAALGIVALDYGFVYRQLAAMFGPGVSAIKASTAVTLVQISRLLKSGALGMSIMAALLAVWPEIDVDLPARRPDPAL